MEAAANVTPITTQPAQGTQPASDAQKKTRPPLDPEKRAQMAQKAAVSRIVKSLKGAKTQEELRALAEEKLGVKVAAASPAQPMPADPNATLEQKIKAYKEQLAAVQEQLAPWIDAAADEVKGTPWELTDGKKRLLLVGLSPYVLEKGELLSPRNLALVTTGLVFGVPTVKVTAGFVAMKLEERSQAQKGNDGK